MRNTTAVDGARPDRVRFARHRPDNGIADVDGLRRRLEHVVLGGHRDGRRGDARRAGNPERNGGKRDQGDKGDRGETGHVIL